jgi:hypothetical protein
LVEQAQSSLQKHPVVLLAGLDDDQHKDSGHLR